MSRGLRGALKAARSVGGSDRYLLAPGSAAWDWVATLGAAVAVAIVYFLAARLGLALLSAPSDVAIFWPASGIAAGILIVAGRRTYPALVIGVVVGTVAANVMSDRSLFTSLFKGFCNSGEAVLVAWLLERWFFRPFTFANLRQVGGFLAAAVIATAASASGGAATMALLNANTTATYWDVWRVWFLASLVGIVVVAPLVIGLREMWREPSSLGEWTEGVVALALTALISFYTISHESGSWLSFSPGALVLPLLLWLTARCPPDFGRAGAFIASAAVILATTFGVGRFGDAAVPLMERVRGAQMAVTTVTLYTLILIALFAQRKEAEKGLRESEGQLAKKSAALARLHEVGARLWHTRDLRQALDEILAGAMELLGADMGAIRIWDSARGSLKIEAHRGFRCEYLDLFRQIPVESTPPCENVMRSGERLVIEDVEQDYRFAPFRPLARAAGYRALQSTRILSREGAPLGVLGTHFRSVHKPAEQDLRLLDLYVRQAADIIEHHKAEDALRRSEERLRLAQLKTGIGIWDWDLRTGTVSWTPELEAIFGLEPESVKNYADFRDRVHPEDIERIEAERDAAVQRRGIFNVEFRIIHSDGQVRWIVATGGALYDEATGEPTRILGNNVDITDRKLAELALTERNLQLALASKAALVGSYTYNVNTRMLHFSKGYAAIYDLPEGTREMTGNQRRALVHPDDCERLDRVRNQAYEQRRGEFSLEYRNILPKRGVRWIESRSLIFYDSNGNPERLVGVNIDITERKLAELALAERNAQLALAGEAALVGSYAYESDLERMAVSEGYAAMHGLPEGTTETTRSEWRTRVHPDDLERLEGFRGRTLGNKRRIYNIEYRIVRASGEVRWIESRSIISYDDNGRPQRVIGINIDVTQHKQTEALLKESESRLSDALAAGHVVAFEWDAATGRSRRSDNANRTMKLVDGGRFLSQVHADDRGKLTSLVRGLSLGKPSYALIFRFVRTDGHQVWLEETAKGEFDATGKLVRIKGLTRDITERKELEDHKNTLISELDHRVKNVLAAVSAVASRTQEASSSMAEFVAALDGRIKSMATAHQLLSHRRWRGIPLAELVHYELAPFATASNTRIEGPDVVLSAEAGQTLAMVFHELATNAAKYGAISVKSGCVSVRWSFKGNGHAESCLCIDWEESGGPSVVPPVRSGFGTSVVRELVPYELGGNVDLMHAPKGVRCKLQIPAHWLRASIPSGEASIDIGRSRPI